MNKDLPGYNIELVKKRIRELQDKYEKEIKPNESDYNEPNTKKGFIEPVFENQIVVILKNNNPGDDCIEERSF